MLNDHFIGREVTVQSYFELQVVESLSLKAIGDRLDRRRLQEELDFHRLYLLTQYYHLQLESTCGEEYQTSICYLSYMDLLVEISY